MKASLLSLLNDLKAVGKHASRSEIGEAFDAHFQSLVIAADTFSGATMSAAAQERGLAQMLERAISKSDSETIPMPRRTRFDWALAAAALALLVALSGMFFLRWNNPTDRLAAPSPPPKISTPDKPQPRGPDIDRKDNVIVKDEPDGEWTVRPNVRPPKHRVKDEPSIIVADRPLGTFNKVDGKPKLFAAGSNVGKPIEPGTKLTAGARIENGDFDAARVELSDGSVVEFGYGAVAEFPRSATDSLVGRYIELNSGALFAQVISTEDEQPFIVKTPFATARALGTSFGLSVEKLGLVPVRSVLQVKKGVVEFSNEVHTVTATEMTESTAEAGRAPTRPKRIRTLRDFVVYYGSSHSHIRHETEQLGEEVAGRRYVYPNGWAGFTVAPKPNGEVRIAQIYTDGPARRFGLRVDDVIQSIDNEPVMDAVSVERAIAAGPGRTLQLEITREGRTLNVTVRTEPRGPRLPDMDALDADMLFWATEPAMVGDTETSLSRLSKMAKSFRIAPVHNNLGVIYETRDDLESAITHFKEAVRLDSQQSVYRYNLAIALQKIGNIQRSIEETEMAVKLDLNHRAAIFFLADAYALVDRFNDAIDVLSQAAQRRPDLPRYWMRMSSVHIRSRNFAEAIRTAERAVQLDPQNQLTQMCLATALVYGESYEEAIGWYEKAISISPAQANSYADMAIALEHFGRLHEAETAFRDAIERAPRSTRIHHQFGQFLARRKRFDEAESEFRLSLKYDHAMVLAHADLGLTLLELGYFSEAEAKLNEAIEMDPHYAHGHGYLGKVFLRTGRYNAAEPLLRKAIDLEPEDVSAYVDMGRMYEARKGIPSAIEWYRRALAIEPGNAEAAQALKRIRG